MSSALVQRCTEMDDDQLVEGLRKSVQSERRSIARLIAHLMEFTRRDLAGRIGFPSLYAYCTQELCYAPGAAYRRIYAARMARRFPTILAMLENGTLHLEGITILGPHLREQNSAQVLEAASGKSCQELQILVSRLTPRLDIADNVQRLPNPAIHQTGCATSLAAPSKDSSSDSSAARDRVEYLSPQRIHFGFTGSEELRQKLERLRQLLWHKHPSGRMEELLEEAVDFYLQRKDPDRKAEARDRSATATDAAEAQTVQKTSRTATASSRRIPHRIKEEVWKRDGGRCAFIGSNGKRCGERTGLEFDHIVPWAMGGRSDDARNIRLLCRGHNQVSARQTFGYSAARFCRDLPGPEATSVADSATSKPSARDG